LGHGFLLGWQRSGSTKKVLLNTVDRCPVFLDELDFFIAPSVAWGIPGMIFPLVPFNGRLGQERN
jgi:hypothetical protein